MSNVIEGRGVPTIKIGTKVHKLPHPKGPDRSSIRQFDFVEVNKGQFFSEGQTLVTVGKKFQFQGALSWEPAGKVTLEMLQLASVQDAVELVLNEDQSAIKFNVKVVNVRYRFSQGLRSGYYISAQFIGTDLLDAPGYRELEIAGWGLDFGNTPDGQSP